MVSVRRPRLSDGTSERSRLEAHSRSNITISGGNVKATGGDFSAGIGGSGAGNCGNITISGGTVEATSVRLVLT